MSAPPSPWDLYHRAKAAKAAADWPLVLQRLTQLAALPEAQRADARLGNAVGWLIHHLGKHLLSLEPPQTAGVIEVLALARRFPYPVEGQPSAYAMLLRLALKVRRDYPTFLDFIAWWDLAHLRPADHQPYTPPGGRPLPALAEQALLGVGKHLLAGYDRSGRLPQGHFDRAAMRAFIARLGPVIEGHPQHRFLPYLRAQLYLALDRPQEALADLQPFVRQHQRQSWAWDWLGRAYYRLAQNEAARACLAQALSLGAAEAMTVLTRERYARLCLEAGETAVAKGALEQVIALRQREWGKIPARILRLIEAPWYHQTVAVPLGPQELGPWARRATDHLYADLPEELAVITGLDPVKGRLWYRLDRTRSGSLRLDRLPSLPQVGDCLRLRVLPQAGREETWYRAITARLSDEAPPSELLRPMHGRLTPVKGRDFGFVGQAVFVPPELMAQWQPQQHREVQVLAIRSYDAKKKQWGWRALRLLEA